MQSMNISLPDSLKQFVDTQIKSEQLETLLLEGLRGEESVLTPADWQTIRQEALAQMEAKKKQRDS
jgi:antitoxin ParD1/3/4